MKTATLFALPLLLAVSLAASAQALTVSWREKPPYSYVEDGVEKGFMLAHARELFATAGIEANFVREPQKRILARFQDGTQNYCSLAWYHLPERAQLAQYTLPIYTDPPQTILIAPAAVARVRKHATLAALMSDPELTLAMVDGVSYGAELDERIKRSKNQIMRRTVPIANLMQMLAADRASYLLADRNDWNYMRSHYRELATVVQHDVPDMAPGLKRHIMCSRDVPAAIIEKLNHAIRTTPKPTM